MTKLVGMAAVAKAVIANPVMLVAWQEVISPQNRPWGSWCRSWSLKRAARSRSSN